MTAKKDSSATLGRRERQIIETVYRLGKAGVGEVRELLPDPPTYSAVRGMLNLLERKGHLTHVRDGVRYLYTPVVSPERARTSALQGLITTFFSGSPLAAAAALLELPSTGLTDAARNRLKTLIEQAEEEGR